MIKIVLPGEVPSWKSPIMDYKRAEKFGRSARPFNPEYKNKKMYRECVKTQLEEGFEPWEGPIGLEIQHFRPIPGYLSKEVSEGDWHCKKPDLTNLDKFAEDVVKGLVFVDDNQVCLRVGKNKKVYSSEARTEINIYKLDP